MPETDPAVLARLTRVEDALQQQAIGPPVHPETGMPLPPIIIDPDSFAGKKWAADLAKYEARMAAERAEEERLRLEREAEEERKHVQWEANRPRREAARKELATVRAELDALNRKRNPLMTRARELREIANR